MSEFLDDRVVYRNLVPLDPRLPPLEAVRAQIGLPAGSTPRKSEPAYAQVIVHLLREARALDGPRARIERLVYVGDTRLNDGMAFEHICRAGGWRGSGFIAAEGAGPTQVEISQKDRTTLYITNRWVALQEFDLFCEKQGYPIDNRTAAVIDLDKTALGARGRNDRVIDQARVEAVRRTVGDLLGEDFDPVRFQAAYDCLNQQAYHPFTSDNQDYLAYVCLILSSGLLTLGALVREIERGRMTDFNQFIKAVNDLALDLPHTLRSIHRGVYALVRQGDPTPFKAFRYNEYQSTVARMGCLPDDAPCERLLAEEIVITEEVRSMALRWRGRGALMLGLSDKPDEASIPREDQAACGRQAIHRVVTHAVGE